MQWLHVRELSCENPPDLLVLDAPVIAETQFGVPQPTGPDFQPDHCTQQDQQGRDRL